MPKYFVTAVDVATIRRTYEVEAKDEEQAKAEVLHGGYDSQTERITESECEIVKVEQI